MTKLILIRHGESEANAKGIFAGQINPDLEKKGLDQAKLTAKHIAGNYKVDKIYSSDLQRAYKTALCLADITGLEVEKNQNLREIFAGDWEGLTFEQLQKKYPDEYGVWMNHIGKARCAGGESVAELGNRVMEVLTKIAKDNEGKTVAVATHATPIRVMQSLVETGGLDEMENIPWVSNASVNIFEYDGNWKIVSLSLDSHLAELKTVLPKNV